MWTRITCLIVLLTAAATGSASSLLARVPDDAIAVVYWAGADSLAPAARGTHLQAVLDHSDIPTFVNDCLPKVLDRIGDLIPGATNVTDAIHQLAPPLWHHRTIIYWAGLTKDQMPRAALICQAGADADALQKTLESLAAQVPMPMLVGREGDLVVVSVGYKNAADALAKPGGGRALYNVPKFNLATEQVMPAEGDAGVALFAYIDGQKAIAAIPTSSAEDARQKDQFMSIWGFDGWNSTALTIGFDGKDWSGKVFIDAPGPRKGIFSFCDKAVDENILKLVPSTATNVFAARFDFGEVFDLVRQTADAMGPHGDFDRAIKQANQAIGMNLRDDLLTQFGPDWVVYSDPQTAGTGPTGLVLANRPKDAAKLADSLTKLEQVANAAIASGIDNPKISVAFKEKTVNGLTLHYLATPLITPTWTVKAGTLYVALYPSVAWSAAEENPGDKTILDNPAFAAMRSRWPGKPAAAISYIDLPAVAPQGYPMILAASRLPGAADLIGVTSPVMILPKYKDLADELAPAGSAVWADAAGIHLASVEPFPGSSMLSVNATALAAGPAMASVMLPALQKARSQAQTVQSASNERQILMGAMMYANDNQGKLPDSLGQLLPYLGNNPSQTAKLFVNPRNPKPIPPGMTKEKAEEWIDENSDYVWKGKGRKLTDIPNASDEIVLYEKPLGLRHGINCGHADGHVEFLTMARAKEKIPDLPIEVVPATNEYHPQPPGGGL